MTTPRSLLARAQRDTHLTSRAIGDARAATRGPEALAARLARRHLTRALYRLLK